jgi:hypothetical protein
MLIDRSFLDMKKISNEELHFNLSNVWETRKNASECFRKHLYAF